MADKAGFLGAYSPWGSRSVTPKPIETPPEKSNETSLSSADAEAKIKPSVPQEQKFSSRYQLSSRDYPRDCPKLKARWFYATDAPKRKAQHTNTPNDERLKDPAVQPKKFSAFSVRDSSAIERAFQELVEKEAAEKVGEASKHQRSKSLGDTAAQNTKEKEADPVADSECVKVPVNEDFLFDVNIQQRELGPAYWLGPHYDVRRGSWFHQEGATLRPCEENLAIQLEQGYLKIKPWQNLSESTESRDASPNPESKRIPKGDVPVAARDYDDTGDDTKELVTDNSKDSPVTPKKLEQQTQRLFGGYMNSVVTYTDATTAWLLTDDLLSRMSSSVYQRFAGGGHFGGSKVIRGYSEAKAKDFKREELAARSKSGNQDEKQTPKVTAVEPTEDQSIAKLERQMSSLDPQEQEAEANQLNEKEIKEDYRQVEGEDQGREIEHLVLVTHGIGQKLGHKLEMLNFISDVNTFRKTLKMVYKASPDLQFLNSEIENPSNCRIQVLPVVWRHQLNFPDQSFKKNREQDLADSADDEEYPSLENISLEPPTLIRTAIRDLGLDILMYQSAYRDHISKIVVNECNRVYRTFRDRHPEFKGKVSLVGHSLGSAILFDVLCQQKHEPSSRARSRTSSLRDPSTTKAQKKLALKFEVEDYYCLGSPLGLYQMLNGRKIVGRHPSLKHAKSSSSSFDDPFLGASSSSSTPPDEDIFSISKSAPKCAQLFNIFHPADPVAYRLEPLISAAMASLKPQPLPYTKKGIFDVQGQGFAALGNRVGQSMSGLWSSVTGGMAASILNRTLGMPADASTPGDPNANVHIQPKSLDEANAAEDSNAEPAPTRIDGELETLYAGFERGRKIGQSDENRDFGESSQWTEADKRSQKLKREEAKVRTLNTNGRVDFVIQT